MKEIRLPGDGAPAWAGMGDYCLVSPDGRHRAVIKYAGEPPHGDSYHRLAIDGRPFPGWAWGCLFAFSPESRYFAFSWMRRRTERKTVVADVSRRRYFVLPKYILQFSFRWPMLSGKKADSGDSYAFTGDEAWLDYPRPGAGQREGVQRAPQAPHK